MLWIISIYAAQVLVGAWLGEKILGVGTGAGAALGRLALGLVILRALGMLPFLGGLDFVRRGGLGHRRDGAGDLQEHAAAVGGRCSDGVNCARRRRSFRAKIRLRVFCRRAR